MNIFPQDCKDGTRGDHCEYCEQGYYGNATVGTPSDCLICACPLPVTSNNFATGCEVDDAGEKISCDCTPGYWGARCESCAAGYYGEPDVEGGFCQPCQCSGNIDTNAIDSCDSVTGECLHCLNNTYGEICHLCAPGYFGDAVERKDCQQCQCTECGMARCDSYNGICECKSNVVGETCDRCEVDHFGYESCNGCEPCDCGVASNSTQCDETTGQCSCKPGVTGRKCDRCIAGYWNYGPEGCISCGCNTGYSIGASCNTTTGQCSCLPGVIGEKCDHCPYRYVLKEGDGCYGCDSCIDDLLDVTDLLANQLAPISREFNTVAESYFTNQRLKFVNDTVDELEPEVRLLDPTRIDFVPLQQTIARLNQEVWNQKRRVEYTADDSVRWRDGAENTLDDMNDLDLDVIREIALVKTIVDDVKSLAFDIESGTGAKVETALKEAEATLKQIQDMSFTKFRDAASDQSGQAKILISEILEYNFPVSNLSSSVDQLGDKLRNFSVKVDDLYLNADEAVELVAVADKLITENKDALEIGNFDMVKNATDEARDDIAAGVQLNRNATEHLQAAALRIDELRRNDLDTAAERLGDAIYNNDQDLLDVSASAEQARQHAESLHELSVDLDDVLTDTRNTSAVRAVSAYRDIDETIGAARKNAVTALQAATNATTISQAIGARTQDAIDKSRRILAESPQTTSKAAELLKGNVDRAREDAKEIDEQNKRNEESLEYIDRVLESLRTPESSSIDESTSEANDVKKTVDEAIDNMKGIVDRIPDDLKETKQLSKNTSDSIRDISQAKKQLDSVAKVVPNISNLLDRLSSNQRAIDSTGNDLLKKIENLKKKVANARELADRFMIGVTFYRNTTLELKNPESLPLLATATKLSLYFRTNKTNGFLLYLGNEEKPNQPRTKTRDFMALMIESGYPVLIMDLGSGPEKVISNRFVSDNVWRQVIVDRTGKNVKLIVREDIGEGKDQLFVKEQALPGTYAIFNLDKDQSKLFVGGYPSSFQIQDAVTASSFEGEMEDLVVGDIPVSFWNFVHGENNRQGAKERDKLVDLGTITGYRFDKLGYVIMSTEAAKIQWNTRKFSIKLKFKTFTEDGLIFLMGRGVQYLSLEIRNGHILYQFNLGSGETVLRSNETYNDGNWHMLEALRLDKIGVLRIDEVLVAKDEGPGKTRGHHASDVFYIGGYPLEDHHYKTVTRVGFDGCIDNIVIVETTIDMSRSVHALGVTPGCPVRFASLVSFEEKTPGFVRWTNVTADNMLQINLKFKTQASDGLIFYATNPDQTANSVLSLVDGRLVFKSQGEELGTSPSAGIKFNDNEWHVVTATHSSQALKLDIDDTENYSTDFTPPPLNIIDGSLYIGGLPNAFGTDTSGSKMTTPFVGCIGDTTLNGAIINFANTKERPKAFLGKCAGGEQPPQPPFVDPPANWPPPPVTDDYDSVTVPPTESNVVDVDLDDTENEKDPGRSIPIEGRPKEQPTPPPTTEKTPEEETTVTPAPPTTVDQCRLPYVPAVDLDTENAWRFGTVRNSRLEYRSLRGRYKDDYNFQIDVKTLADDGIIFYAAKLDSPDVIAVYLDDGKVNYKFDCGSGPAVLTSSSRINDNQWHTVVFTRQGNFGELIVDEDQAVSGYSQGNIKTIDVSPPFYVGGILPEISTNVYGNIGMNNSINGCLGNFMMNGQTIDDPEKRPGVIPCSRQVEPGLFFYPGDGSNLFKAMDKFSVGRIVDIQMEIKPRSGSGHLLSIHGRRDYLLLEMVNGTIKFLIKAAKGPIETSFEPTLPNSLCDGNWHSIRGIVSEVECEEKEVDNRNCQIAYS